MTPKVSVVVPVFNAEAYLAQCLDSLVNQSLTDIEVILVDDCSADGSSAVIRRYTQKDHRIRPLTHATNLGFGGARNTGIEAASGEYLAFVDADDWIRKDGLELVYELCKDHDAQVGLFPAVDYFEDSGEYRNNRYTDLRVPRHFRVAPETIGSICATVWTKLYQRDLLLSSGVRFVDHLYHEDEAFHFCFFAKAEPRVSTLPERIYYYRQHAASAMAEQRSSRRDLPDILANIWDFYRENGLDRRYGGVFVGFIRSILQETLPVLDHGAQEGLYSGIQDLVRRMAAEGLACPLPEPVAEVLELHYVEYLESRQRDLRNLRHDAWYRFGRLPLNAKIRRALKLALRGLRPSSVAKALTRKGKR